MPTKSASRVDCVRLILLAVVAAAISLVPETACGAQIYVTSQSQGTVGAYTTSGATLNAILISGLQTPNGIAVADGFIYVTNASSGTIGKYTTEGEAVDTALVSGLRGPTGIVISGDKLFVSNTSNNTRTGTVGEYTTDGTTVNASLITGLGPYGPTELVLSGTDLYVQNGSFVSKYTTSGALINATLIHHPNESGPEGIAVAGGKLFEVYSGLGTIAEFDATTGAAVNPNLISLINPYAIAEFEGNLYVTGGSGGAGVYSVDGVPIAPNLLPNVNTPSAIVVVPEPSAMGLIGVTAALLLRRRRYTSWARALRQSVANF